MVLATLLGFAVQHFARCSGAAVDGLLLGMLASLFVPPKRRQGPKQTSA